MTNHRTPRYVLPFILALLAIVFASACSITKSGGGLPVHAALELVDENGKVAEFIISNTRQTLARCTRSGRVRLVDTATGATLAILEFQAKGDTLLIDRDRDFRGTFKPGEKLPAWVRETWLGTQQRVEFYGYEIEASSTPTP